MDTALKKVHDKTEELMRSDEAYRNYLIRRDMSKMDCNSEAKYQFNRGMQQGTDSLSLRETICTGC